MHTCHTNVPHLDVFETGAPCRACTLGQCLAEQVLKTRDNFVLCLHE